MICLHTAGVQIIFAVFLNRISCEDRTFGVELLIVYLAGIKDGLIEMHAACFVKHIRFLYCGACLDTGQLFIHLNSVSAGVGRDLSSGTGKPDIAVIPGAEGIGYPSDPCHTGIDRPGAVSGRRGVIIGKPCKRRINFIQKKLVVRSVISVMIELEDIRLNILA